MLERIHQNLTFLAGAADLQTNSRFALREHRELISKEDLNDFHQRFPYQDSLFVRQFFASYLIRLVRRRYSW